MISQLSRNIFAQTQEYSRLQQLVAQAAAVRTTYQLLDELGTALQTWAGVFVVMLPLIDSEARKELRKDASSIARQLETSKSEFNNGNFQQAAKLTQLKAKVDKLRTDTKEAWKEYAQAEIAPYQELTNIAERLPKMARQLDKIEGYLASAHKLAKELPTKPDNVEQFHNYLARLASLLSDLEGLPSDVRVFLDRLVRGDAMFADVTQTVFDWCRDEGLSGKLRITLG